MCINHSESLARAPHICVSWKIRSWQLCLTRFTEIADLKSKTLEYRNNSEKNLYLCYFPFTLYFFLDFTMRTSLNFNFQWEEVEIDEENISYQFSSVLLWTIIASSLTYG